MSESLRDLVVSLSLQTDNFTRNIRSVNKQIQEAESFFKLASAGVENFEQTTQGLSTRLSTLQQKLTLQKEVVDQYSKALDAARTKLKECYDRQGEYANRLAAAQQNQAQLNQELQDATEAYRDCRDRLGEADQATMDANTRMEQARERYNAATAEVKKLSGQCTALEKATLNAADAVSTGNSNLNKASAAVRQTEADIQNTNQALRLARTNWMSAGETIKASQQAISSVGGSMRQAESEFRLATVGIENIEQSTAGLSAQLDMLQSKWGLQSQAITHYETALQAAREQLAAAQSVNDPQKIRQATDAVTEAQTALNLAKAALQQTGQQIDDTNQALALAETNWYAAGTAIDDAHTAIVGIGKQIQVAENNFRTSTAGIKDMDTSVSGLTQKLSMLEGKLALQRSAVQQYEAALAAAREQLQAAQAVNDPDKIQEATAAVQDAEVALSRARLEVAQTRAEIDDTNKNLRTAASAWTSLGEACEDAGKRLDATGKAATSIGRTMSTTISAPLAALGATSVKASIDFESSFASVRKTVDATEAEFDALAASSKEMSTKIASSTDEINEVMATGGQLGIANQYLADFTRVMIDLGNSCEDLNADDAAASIAKFANVMGTSQSLFSNIGSTIVALGNNFATTEKPIMEMAQRLAGAGKQVGLTEAQVLGFATALSSVGIEAEMGGAAFSKALIKMEVACATGGEALEGFAMVCGMTGQQFKTLFESDPAAAFEAFIVGLSNLDESGESAIAVLDEIGIKEVRLRDTMLRAVNATELFSSAQALASQAWSENTALSEEANKRYATTESRLTNLKNKALLFGQALGDDVSPTIQNLISGADDLLDKFLEMDSAQRQQVLKWAAIVASIGPAILIYGKVSSSLGTMVTGIGKFATAVGKAGGGFGGFMSVLGKSPSVWLAVAAAVVVGTVAFVDFVSGAKAAREALKGMEETAKSWKETAAETFYNQSEGLSFFGMSASDFQSSTKSSQEWLDGLIAVWTDGEKETNDIVTSWTDSFKALTSSTRTSLEELKTIADTAGYTGVSAQIQSDIDALDSMDAEISNLLKKRQNGYLTDSEKIRLQELIDTREAIEIKYNLSPNDGAEGFDTIAQKLEAEVARAQARGLTDAPVEVYENALVACAEGMAAVNGEIDAQYDKEFAIIQLIEDEGERKAAQEALDAKYRTDRLAAAREYAFALTGAVMPVWEQENIQQAAADVGNLTQALREYSALDTEGKKGMLGELNELTASMDEDSLVEYIGLLTQIQTLLDSGMTESEVQSLFPEIDFSSALDQLAAIQQYLNENSWDPNLTSLQDMFGEALPDEMITLTTDLDMTGAQARWDEFAANPGAITTEAIISGIAEDENAARQQVKVDAVIEKYTETPEGADKSTLSSEGLIAYVATYAEATTGVDTSALNPQNVTAIVSAYQELEAGVDVSTLKPDEIVAYVQKYMEKEGIDMTGLTPEVLTATVMAYEEASGGASTKALTPDDVTATVVKYLEAEGVDISALSPGQIEAIVTSFAEAADCDKSQLLTSFTAYVTEYKNAEGVVLPTIEAKVGLTGYDTLAYRRWVAMNPVEVAGVVRIGEIYDNPGDAATDEDVKFYDRKGLEIPVSAVPQESLTADTVAVLSEDGTLHVLITPEITGTEEAIAEMRTAVDEVDQLGVTMAGRAIGLLPTTLMDYVDSALQRIETYKNPGFLDFAWLTDLIDSTARLETLDSSMQSSFNAENIAELSTYVSEVVAAIQSGEEVKAEDIENLQSILTLISELDTLGIGGNVTQGIAQGMTDAGWDTDAETVVANLETAINTALDAHSPAHRMVPIGENVAAGIGQGAFLYDYTADAEAIAAAAQSALQTAFAGDKEGSPSKSIGEALAAGISQGAADYDFTTYATTVASALEGAIGASMSGAEAETGSMQSIGTAVGTQIGSGMSSFDFVPSAATMQGNLTTAIGAVVTASTLTNYGQMTMGGLANALSGYSFSGTGRSISTNVRTAVSGNLNTSTLRSVGVNAMAGLTAGINAGRSGVVSAMRSAAQAAVAAAKSTLKIKSPSRVFRDEIGAMTMKGFGEGVLTESRAQARIIRNAARFLTDEAREGAIVNNTTTQNRTYNQQSSVTLTGNTFTIRDEQDIYALANEIAALTRRQQRGKGLRMA